MSTSTTALCVDPPAPDVIWTCGRLLWLPDARSDVCDRPHGHCRRPEPGSLVHHGTYTDAWWVEADGAQLCGAGVPTGLGVCQAAIPCPVHGPHDLMHAMCEQTWRVPGSTHADDELITYRRHRCGVRGPHSALGHRCRYCAEPIVGGR